MRMHLCQRVLILGVILLAGACDARRPDPVALDVQVASEKTLEAVARLFRGDDDFGGIVATLDEAVRTDPGNRNAAVFLAITRVLQFLDDSLTRPGGQLRSLVTRSGFAVPPPTAQFWTMQITPVPHTQGTVIDSAPRALEVANFLQNDLLPRLESLVAALEAVPASFSWFVAPGEFMQHPLAAALPVTRQRSYEIDRGDLRMLAAALNVAIAQARFLLGYEHGNLDPNDFDVIDHPNVDPLLVIQNNYLNVGNVRSAAQLTACRDRLERAWDDYQVASAHIRGESPRRQAQGILTLAPGVLVDPTLLAQFLADEAAFRTWMTGIVGAFRTNANLLIDRGPNGVLLPPEEQVAVNLFRLFAGVNLRTVFLSSVVDPFTGFSRLGVTSPSLITPAMLTAGGVLASIGGVVPVAGDLQGGAYAVRVDNPPTSTKVIDGNHNDWTTGSVVVAGPPRAAILPSTADLGSVYVARDANNLYLRIDRDLQTLIDLSAFGSVSIQVDWLNGTTAGVWLSRLSPVFTWSSNRLDPVAAVNTAGIELATPVPAGPAPIWAAVSVEVFADQSGAVLANRREALFVRVQ
ncbi:MAG: hypothetical protein IPK26_23655 [Planctomycetes bacterium]|nr:hypothetical protein [Planctomycetota bacterium]